MDSVGYVTHLKSGVYVSTHCNKYDYTTASPQPLCFVCLNKDAQNKQTCP